jgi:hypothetical protein
VRLVGRAARAIRANGLQIHGSSKGRRVRANLEILAAYLAGEMKQDVPDAAAFSRPNDHPSVSKPEISESLVDLAARGFYSPTALPD